MGFPSKPVYHNIIYRYKYGTDFVNVGIKLLNTKTKETKNGHTGDLVEHNGLFFRMDAYSNYDIPLFLL
jgi:hypothetical protein